MHSIDHSWKTLQTIPNLSLDIQTLGGYLWSIGTYMVALEVEHIKQSWSFGLDKGGIVYKGMWIKR